MKLFSDELKIAPEELETDEPFQDYGVDSIILAQLLQQMNQALKEDLDPSVLYEHPTIDAFAEWLVSNGSRCLQKGRNLIQKSWFRLPYKRFTLNKSVMP